MIPQAPSRLLDKHPLVRANCLHEASERIGRVFSPHRLALHGPADSLDVHHNQVKLRDVSLNVLHYGASVVIDPGERGDFYLIQLPVAGSARLTSGADSIDVDDQMLSVLQPGIRSHMHWSAGCTMILVQVARSVVQRRALSAGAGPRPQIALSRPRGDPMVGAWWQAVIDLTANIDRFGEQWLRHPVALGAMEEFLLTAFTSMLCEPLEDATLPHRSLRCLQRAKDYIHAHADSALTLGEIARHANACPRTLEAVFKRHESMPPLAYARRHRLQVVHQRLRDAARDRLAVNVTDVAMAHGFLHMGRFAAQYRVQFGCSPSETLRPH